MGGVGGWTCHDLYFLFSPKNGCTLEAMFERLSIPSVFKYIDRGQLDLGIDFCYGP